MPHWHWSKQSMRWSLFRLKTIVFIRIRANMTLSSLEKHSSPTQSRAALLFFMIQVKVTVPNVISTVSAVADALHNLQNMDTKQSVPLVTRTYPPIKMQRISISDYAVQCVRI